MKRWLGLKDLIADAALSTTDLVEETHRSVTRRVFGVAKFMSPSAEPIEVVERVEHLSSASVYASVRLGAQVASRLVDAGFRILAESAEEAEEVPTPMSSAAVGSRAWTRDAALGVLNGVVGDFLARRENSLSLGMSLRREGRQVLPEVSALKHALPDAQPKLCVFVHGLACTEWSWSAYAEQAWGDPALNYAELLEQDHGYSVLYVRYNSGLRIAENGRALAQLLQQLTTAYPRPLEQLVLVGHSMGGLVSRSAAHYAAEFEHTWTDLLTHLVCLGSPHHGAPLEKAGHLLTSVLLAFDTPGTQVPAKIINARSAGIKDLRFGALLDEDSGEPGAMGKLQDLRKPAAQLPHVKYHFIAASISQDPNHPLGHALGDLLVRTTSARGLHPEAERVIALPEGHTALLGGTSHLGLVNHPKVYEQLVTWLEGPGAVARAGVARPPATPTEALAEALSGETLVAGSEVRPEQSVLGDPALAEPPTQGDEGPT